MVMAVGQGTVIACILYGYGRRAGHGDRVYRTTPVRVMTLAQARADGVGCGRQHTMAIVNGGVLAGWGDNEACQVLSLKTHFW